MNKKKICVGIIVVLIIINVVCCVKVFSNYKNKKIAKENITETLEKIDNNQVAENKENTINDEEINVNIEPEQIAEIQEKIRQEETHEKQHENMQIQSNNVISSDNNKQIETTQPTKINEPQTQQVEQKNEPTKDVIALEQLQSTTTEENTQIDNEEKYVRNDAMINQIKSTIENNASEYMVNYGYEVVVDSSIKDLTNQFTYTENRVKSAISNKFGNIRIYAEDYYKNGQLIMTECYIL